eukprot:scaffold102096_cov31-Tisochrysis_lutea.AAC.1
MAPSMPPYAPSTSNEMMPDAPPSAPPSAPPAAAEPSAPSPYVPGMAPPLAPQGDLLLPPPAPPGGSQGDPHLTFAHGGKADFRGCDGCYFNFLSGRDLAVNVKTEEAIFKLRGAVVHGTFLTEVHVAAYIRPANVWMNLSYWSSEVGDGNWGWRVVNGSCADKPFVLGPKAVKECGPYKVLSDYASAKVVTEEWDVRILARPVYDQIQGPTHRLDLALKPLVAERDLSAWPHGIIGQSFDGDNLPINGKQDDYSGSLVHTTAMAEGAIEGVATDYQVAHPFETHFKYSRFDSTMASSRPRTMAHFRSYEEMPSLAPISFASSTEHEETERQQ